MSYSHPNVIELQCLSLKHLFTVIRDQNTERGEYVRYVHRRGEKRISLIHFFVRYARRLMSIICEEGLACVNPIPKIVMTPTSAEFHGSYIDHSSIVAISIIRAGDSMLVSQ